MSVFIPILLGTARVGRQTEKVARFVLREMQSTLADVTLVDVRDHMLAATTPPWQPDTKPSEWSAIMARADGLIIVCPEYNHSFPGEFKLVFDSAFKEYMHKPVAYVTVSSGGFGGTRLVETLQNVTIKAGMVPISYVLNVSQVKTGFTDEGEPADEKTRERFVRVRDELLWFAQVLKPAREIRENTKKE